MKKVVVLADAAEDIEAARDFYEMQDASVGEYCVDSLLTDIESLGLFSGVHPLISGFIGCWRAASRLVFIIVSTAMKFRYLQSFICVEIQRGFAKN